jgi:dipeptidyl aminopeptidase/acylaminoacyl peptidase
MTTDRSADERIRLWLREEAPGQVPDRVLQAAFAQTRPMRQRRTILGWTRFPTIRIGAAVTAIGVAVVVLLAGFLLLPSSTPSVGGPAPTATPPPRSLKPSLAPVSGLPGRFAFASRRDGDYDIYVMNPDRTGLRQLTDAAGDDVGPIWSRDGSRIAFASDRDGDFDVYVINADGTAEIRIADIPGDQLPGGWSSDGLRLAYATEADGRFAMSVLNVDGSGQRDLIGTGDGEVQFVSGGDWLTGDTGLLVEVDESTTGGEIDVYRLDVDNGSLTALTSSPGDDGSAALSPDGSRIAFQADRNGGCVYVMNVDGTGATQLTTGCRTGFPITWSPDGAWIGWAGARGGAGPADIRAIEATGGSELQLTDSADMADLAWGPPLP